LQGKYIQLERLEVPLPLPKQYVIVRRYLDGSLHVFNQEDHSLKFTELKSKPKGKVIRKPAKDHPCRRVKYG